MMRVILLLNIVNLVCLGGHGKKHIYCIVKKLLILIISLFLILLLCACSEKKLDNAYPSVVTIINGVDIDKGILTSDVIVGTGFCYKPNRIVTNYHDIKNSEQNTNIITHDDIVLSAKLIAKDEQSDIALLEIDADIPHISFADSDKCNIGQKIMSISTPISTFLKGTYSEGLISNLNIIGFGTQRLMQTNINLSPGCSGGPLFDSSGQVVGMVTFKSTEFGAESLGFAIPSNRLKKIIDRLEQGVETLNLGITFQSDIYQKFGIPGAKGLAVQDIDDGSLLYGKLQEGDLLIKINGIAIHNLIEYTEALEQLSYNHDLDITIKRSNKEQTIFIKRGE